MSHPALRLHFKRGNIVAEVNVSPFAAPGSICCGSKIGFPGNKTVSEFVQKQIVSSFSATAFPCFRAPSDLSDVEVGAKSARTLLDDY